ncbi:hypothetical protein PRZ48_013175 [Zasmidium cellare]|uniref:Uncharacterized protein n=1 Tax=Zasmidium cellare TaxID=395010 RepID=A0ABR0E3A8_ZASCE|nr:hypothetical protein PRZ48_013175 [Zasmidium cellare]
MDSPGKYGHIPIPTYDEATSLRPSSSQNLRGPHEVSDDAERQGLLPNESRYRPPTVESPRSSQDSDLRLPEVTGEGDDERRQIEELDYLDPSAPDPAQRESRLYHRARLRSKFSQHLSNLGATLSSIRLPSFRSLYTPVSTDTSADPPPPSTDSWLTRTIQRFPTVPEQYRMSAGTAARLCGLLSIAILIYVLFILDVFPGNARFMGTRFDPESVRAYVQDNVDAMRIEDYLAHITGYDHVAGSKGDLYLAEYMKEQWLEEGNLDDIALLSYYVYLNYPTPDGRSVEIVSPENKKWRAVLEEEVNDPNRQQTLAWHGNSKNGEVEGHLVYANGGSREDFAWLKEQGVQLNGSIALMRYYSTQGDRALKIKAAEEAGCVGALIYSDPSDDGSVKGAVWPDGPWRPDDSLQRGGVSMMSFLVGDPLTPGYASTLDATRISKDDNVGLTKIPSLPLAWRDAKVLLQSLQGHGKQVPKDWVGGSQDFANEWFSGAEGSDGPVVHLKNLNDENELQQIWNLHGMIEGLEQPKKKIIVGNHRDSWCFGAVDPGSGSAVMMEMVRIFGELRKLGWRPLRTIEFVSWDAEEYNLVGSTEYVEDNLEYLRVNGVAYLNVDVGVYGPDPVFQASGSPVWQRSLLHVLDRISSPDANNTLRDIWEQRQSQFEGLGAGSDYVAFQDIAGTSSIDFGFGGAEHGFPYHSCLETFDWVKRFGDPDLGWHRTLAQVWALLILEIADRPIVPYDLKSYADKMKGPYLDSLRTFAEKKLGKRDTGIDLQPLVDIADELSTYADEFHRFEDIWTSNVLGAGGLENSHFAMKRIEYNNKVTNFERDLLDIPVGDEAKDGGNEKNHGLPGRRQFKHAIFAPKMWDGYGTAYFPFVWDAVERGDVEEAQRAVEKTVGIIRLAIERLKE